MKTLLEEEDIQGIASEVIERLKPYLSNKVESRADDIIFDVPGLCEYLHVTPKWVYERSHLREIPFIKLSGKQLRFKKKDIDKWIESLKTPVVSEYRGKSLLSR